LGNPVRTSWVARWVDRSSARRSKRNGHDRSTANAIAPSEPDSTAIAAVTSNSCRCERSISTRPMMAPESYKVVAADISGGGTSLPCSATSWPFADRTILLSGSCGEPSIASRPRIRAFSNAQSSGFVLAS
jgi:hypothetical protein